MYLINAEMKRQYFPNTAVFYSWYADFSSVKTIPNTCIGTFKSGGGINFRPGSVLFKTVISPDVYAIGPGNKKLKIGSEQVAKDLYGDNWASLVQDMADVFDANYTLGTPLTESKPHDGMVVKKKGDSKVYSVQGGKLHEVSGNAASKWTFAVSESVFSALGMGDTTVKDDSLVSDPSQKGGLEVKHEVLPGAVVEVDVETKTEVKTETKTDTATETKTETKTEAKTDTATETKTEVKTETKTDTATETKTETKTEAKTDTTSATSNVPSDWAAQTAVSNLTGVSKVYGPSAASFKSGGILGDKSYTFDFGLGGIIIDQSKVYKYEGETANSDKILLVVDTDDGYSTSGMAEATYAALKSSLETAASGYCIVTEPTYGTASGEKSFATLRFVATKCSLGLDAKSWIEYNYAFADVGGGKMLSVQFFNAMNVQLPGGTGIDSAKRTSSKFMDKFLSLVDFQ
ncbi:MAG: hypothetical protein HYY51_03980 [Candidatus Magasanikbacteria bacterium]|nr:hypothetical protein [Candidatus Magasanikbacteria bacterium]